MISLQTTADLHNVISTTDATITGILIAVVLAFGFTIVYLFKYVRKMNEEREVLYKEFIGEVKIFNSNLMLVNKEYHDAIKNLVDLYKR